MALVKNVLLQGIRGKLGDKVYRVMRGKTFVQAAPVYNKNRIPSQNELAARARFTNAIAFARKAMVTWKLREYYEKVKKAHRGMTIFGIAVRNAMENPVVLHIDTRGYNGLPGSKILIRVEDSVKVMEVTVSIITADGILVEQGAANAPVKNPYDWVYKTRAVNHELKGCKVIVVAKNLPGNEGVKENVIEIGSKQRKKRVKATVR
jgi:hypothetical protein